ncbi:hypothetical protein ACFL2F_03580 [Myxococcota bacterium]
MEANDDFFNEFYNCVGSAARSEQMKLVVKAFAPEITKNAFSYYRIPDVSSIIILAKTIGTVIASDHSTIEAKFKGALGVTPTELDANLSACFALINQNPDAAGHTAEDLRLFAEVMRKNFTSSRERNFDSYDKNYRRYMLTLSVLEMGMAKKAGPDPTAVASFKAPAKTGGMGGIGGLTAGLGDMTNALRDVNRAAASGDKGRLNDSLSKAEKATDATEADAANLNAMIDVAEGYDSGSMNEDEAAAALGKLDKARERNKAAYESAGEGEGGTADENVGKARADIGGVKADLAAGKKAKCTHLLKDLKEVKAKCDAGKKIFCEAFGEKRDEFVKSCGKNMLPKEMAK